MAITRRTKFTTLASIHLQCAASDYSLVISILETILSNEVVRLTAVVIGPHGVITEAETNGRMNYSWISWRVDLMFIVGYKEIGTSSSVDIREGVHNVILQVEDLRTHAIARTQQIVYARRKSESTTHGEGGSINNI